MAARGLLTCVLSTVVKEPTMPAPFKKPSCACILVLIVSKGWPVVINSIGKGFWIRRGRGDSQEG